MGPESFDEVRALDDAALRGLLSRGRPEQRVWAIWALAQRAGEAAGAFARDQAKQPDPGVRRTLAVILASHGEIDLLIALARQDPSLAVRASALQLGARLLAGAPAPSEGSERGERGEGDGHGERGEGDGHGERGELPALHELRALIAAEREPEMVIAILGAIGAGAPELLLDIAVRALGAPSLEVQLEAVEALLRAGTPPAFEEARRWLLGLEDPSVACAHWIRGAGGLGGPSARAAGVDSLSRALAGASVEARARVLRQLVAPPWDAAARLMGGSDALLSQVLHRRDISIPAHVLAGAILRGQEVGFVRRLTLQLRLAGHEIALLADVRRALLDADAAHATLADLSGRALGYVRAREIAGGEEVLAELAHLHLVEQLVGLENALARWVDDPSAGALYGELPELRAYCERRVAELEAAADAALWRGRRRWPALHEGGADDGDAAVDGDTAAGDEEIDADGEGDFDDDGAGNSPWELQHDFETLIAAIDAVAPGPLIRPEIVARRL